MEIEQNRVANKIKWHQLYSGKINRLNIKRNSTVTDEML